MNSPPSPAVDDGPRKGALGEVWAFLNRDVRTFKWGPLGERALTFWAAWAAFAAYAAHAAQTLQDDLRTAARPQPLGTGIALILDVLEQVSVLA